jgi:hypothetical protein
MLDERNVAGAMQTPEEYASSAESQLRPSAGYLTIELLPFAVARVTLA